MTYDKALAYVHALHRFGRKPELTRMELLMEKLGNPHRELKFVHVAGTNGKGSTTVMLSSILREAGYKVGTYTSPYIVDFRERIVLDGEMISQKELAALVSEVADAATAVEQEYDAPREFEFITACALLYYHRKQCDIVVLEVGLGGRYDATNIIPAPLVSVICPIGLDHVELLGDDLAGIAREKCGIIKTGCAVVTNPTQPPEALDVILEHCRRLHCALALPQLTQLKPLHNGIDGSRFVYHGYEFGLSLVGKHQVDNAITAIDAALTLTGCGFAITLPQVASGIAKAYIPGRFEVFAGSPTVILDGAHNPHGMSALRESIFSSGLGRVTAVIGMLADKNSAEALDIIAPYLEEIVVTEPDSPRALPAAELGRLAANYCRTITIEPDCQKAVRLAMNSGCNTVLIFGSLYLVSSVRPMVLGS